MRVTDNLHEDLCVSVHSLLFTGAKNVLSNVVKKNETRVSNTSFRNSNDFQYNYMKGMLCLHFQTCVFSIQQWSPKQPTTVFQTHLKIIKYLILNNL